MSFRINYFNQKSSKVHFLRKSFFLLVLVSLSPSCDFNKESTSSSKQEIPSIPIQFELIPSDGDMYKFRTNVQPGFGIQKDAPNSIVLEAKEGLKISNKFVKFSGKLRKDKPEYFEFVEDIPIQVENKGVLRVTGKVFYCDYKQNICIPGRVFQEIQVR